MKKKEFFAIVALMALVGVFVACNNDDECQTQISNEVFTNELTGFLQKQKDVITEGKNIIMAKSQMRKTSGASMDEILDIARQLDYNISVFVNNNRDQIHFNQTTEEIPEEIIDIISIDSEVLLQYVEDNYSSTTQEIMRTIISNGNLESLMNLDNLSNADMFIIACAVIVGDFDDLLLNSPEMQIPSEVEENQDINYCATIRDIEIDGCEASLATMILTIIGGVSAGVEVGTLIPGIGNVGGALIGSGIAIYSILEQRRNCILQAWTKYRACISHGKKN